MLESGNWENSLSCLFVYSDVSKGKSICAPHDSAFWSFYWGHYGMSDSYHFGIPDWLACFRIFTIEYEKNSVERISTIIDNGIDD